jgi:hypothetical protein
MSPRNTLRLPNLLVIGAQKCGTTWLYERLRRHPDIFLSKTKELSFFGKQDAMSARQRRDISGRAIAAGIFSGRGRGNCNCILPLQSAMLWEQTSG